MKTSNVLILLAAVLTCDAVAAKETFLGIEYTVHASSVLEEGNRKYPASNLLPPSVSKAWCEGLDGDGIGQWVQIKFSESVSPKFRISVLPGYAKTDKLFKENGRPADIEVFVNGKFRKTIHFDDIPREQVFELNSGGTEVIKDVTLSILKVYSGEKHNDTCISGVAVSTNKDWWQDASDREIEKESSSIQKLFEQAMKGDLDSIETLIRMSGGAYYHTAEGGEWLQEIYLDLFVKHPYRLLFLALRLQSDTTQELFGAISKPISDKYGNKQLLGALKRAVKEGIDEELVKTIKASLE